MEEKRAEAARILRKEAVRLAEYYEEWPGLPASSWVDNNGVPHPCVETGLPCREQGGFSALPVGQTGVATDGTLRMAVRTWVEGKDPDLWVSVVLSLRLSSVDNNRVNIDVQVEQDEQDEPIRVFITRTDEEAWEEVVESIKRHIQAALKKRYPPAYL